MPVHSFDYGIIRVVPRVERQEFINAGVVVLCPEQQYLGCRIHLDEVRLKALWPGVDGDVVRKHLEAIERICAGSTEGGPIAKLSVRERFHWLVAARSTIIQCSPVHTGVCEGAMDDVLDRLAGQFL